MPFATNIACPNISTRFIFRLPLPGLSLLERILEKKLPDSALYLNELRDIEKGVLAKGVSAGSSVTPKEIENFQG